MENIIKTDEAEKRVVYPTTPKPDEENDRRYRRWKRKIPTILAWTAVVIVVALLVLFISSKVGRFESIPEMMQFIQQFFR